MSFPNGAMTSLDVITTASPTKPAMAQKSPSPFDCPQKAGCGNVERRTTLGGTEVRGYRIVDRLESRGDTCIEPDFRGIPVQPGDHSRIELQFLPRLVGEGSAGGSKRPGSAGFIVPKQRGIRAGR